MYSWSRTLTASTAAYAKSHRNRRKSCPRSRPHITPQKEAAYLRFANKITCTYGVPPQPLGEKRELLNFESKRIY
jgi:hypothetical protein